MSYILDALKKSDHERSRERGPTLASVHGGWQPPVPWIRRHGAWLLTAGILLGLVAGAAWLLLPSLMGQRADSQATVASTAPQDPVEKGRVARTADPGAVVDDAGTSNLADAPVATPPVIPAPVRSIQELWELPDPVRAAFPALTFSFHVYAETPARRTIIINNRRYAEGDTLNPETRLEEITEQGVILWFREYRVYIPITNNW